jgi:YHS domain-containing protein
MWILEPLVENRLPRFSQKSKNVALAKILMKNRRRLVISFVVLLGFSMLLLGQAKQSSPRPEKARDPVCGIMVEKDPQLAAEYKGKAYYFCSKADREKFKQNPQKYVKDK